ncbi:putative aldo-keto reductase [Mycena venus]|uniref:Putative aldo-keto reductase n=1 Tax=Mycena venus TaxID=2733690 RepID=A0A8H7CMD3_9AGAR|nr:putative aldo-keto reductase [Mycena venus]
MTGARGDPEYMKEQSLVRTSQVDPNTPIEKTVGAMAELVKEGKVKYLGLSDCTAAGLDRANALRSPSSTSSQQRARTGRKSSPTHPLGRGFLTGQIKSIDDLDADDFRRTVPKFSAGNFSRILDLADKIGEVGKAHNATSGQKTLAWSLAQGDDFFVIPGTKKPKYLYENAGAASVKLTAEEIAEVRWAAEATEIPGDRYGAAFNEMTYVDSPPL